MLQFVRAWFAVSSLLSLAIAVVAGCSSTMRRRLHNNETFSDTPGPVAAKFLRAADEIVMAKTLNATGRRVLDAASTQACKVDGVLVNGMEGNITTDGSIVSCKVSRYLLTPVDNELYPLTGDVSMDVQTLESMLSSDNVASAYCNPNSTTCTVAFDKRASALAVTKYNEMLGDTFGIGALEVGDVRHSGTMYVKIPTGPNTSAPKRMRVRVEDDGTKSFMVYKFVRNSRESPADLWASGSRNDDVEDALDADSDTLSYCSELLGEQQWSAFKFSHVVVEARRGDQVLCKLRFRGTQHRTAWFHPKFLTAAEFNGQDAGGGFASRLFQHFRIQQDNSRLFWSIMDETDEPDNCADGQRFFLCVPYGDTACAATERLHGRVIVAPSGTAPVAAAEYSPNTATHLVVWLVASGIGGGDRTDASPPPYQSDGTRVIRMPTLAEQMPDAVKNILVNKMEAPTRAAPVILGNNCGSDEPGWQARLGPGEYTRERLETLLAEEVKPPGRFATMVSESAAAGAPATPTLYSMNRVRFHTSARVVLFGEAPSDFSTDAEYVAVLQDVTTLQTFGIAANADREYSKRVHIVGGSRSVDAPLLTYAEQQDGSSSSSSYKEVCLTGVYDSSVRSMIVENVGIIPVQASVKCGGAKTFETSLHISSHPTATKRTDMLGNAFDLQNLRRFVVAAGYVAHAFSQPGFKGTRAVIRGPGEVCLAADAPGYASLRVVYGRSAAAAS